MSYSSQDRSDKVFRVDLTSLGSASKQMYVPMTTKALLIQLILHMLRICEESRRLLHKASAHLILAEHLKSAHVSIDLADFEVSHQ